MKRTWKPTMAGILNIISGVLLLIGGITIINLSGTPMAAAITSYHLYSVGSSGAVTPEAASLIISVTTALLIILGAVALLGGICAVKRKFWGLALTGAISASLSLLFPGIPAIALTALSKKDFAQPG